MLLKRDFGIDFTMPINHLCPPVPQRLNYIHWVADLLESPYYNTNIIGLDMFVSVMFVLFCFVLFCFVVVLLLFCFCCCFVFVVVLFCFVVE